MKTLKNYKTYIALVLFVLLIVGYKIKSGGSKSSATALTEPLSRGNLIEAVYGIGTVVSNKIFTFRTGVSTTVRSLHVKEGDQVKRNQILVELDATGPVRAPFDGTVTFLPVKQGETVFAQSIIATITDLSDRYLSVSLEQRGAVRVKSGLKARISFDSMRDQRFEGKVEAVYSNDSAFLVRIKVDKLPPQILPGMSADVAIGISEKKNVLLVPVSAIENDSVKIKTSRSDREEKIKVGLIDGAFAEFVSGELKEGDVLVIQKRAP